MSSIPQDLEAIAHIGVGEGREVSAYLNSNAKRIVLVEPNPLIAERLREYSRQDTRVEVHELAVCQEPERNQLRVYNLAEAASLYEPTALLHLYPGLKVSASHTVKTLIPEALMAELELGEGPNLLVLQAPGAEQGILEGLLHSNQMKRFEYVWITVPNMPYYDSNSQSKEALAVLESAGHSCRPDASDNSDWPCWHSHRDPLTGKVQELETQIQQLQKELAQRTERHNKKEKEAKILERELSEERKAHDVTTNRLKAIEETRSDALVERLIDVTRHLSNHFDKKLNRSNQSIERTLSLQNYLQTGSLPINQSVFPPISADLGLYLAEKVETRQYDLIIEFGSGGSTVLLAHTALHRLGKAHRSDSALLKQDAAKTSVENLANTSPVDTNFPKRLVSFEHRKDACERLQPILQVNGLQSVVDVCHSPLVDYQYQQKDYLHYDCDAMLERIAKLYQGRTARLLILVSGPPMKAGVNAQLPALPKLLNYLDAHELDVVLQCAPVRQMQSISAEWLELLKQRGVSCRQQLIDLEAGSVLFAVNER